MQAAVFVLQMEFHTVIFPQIAIPLCPFFHFCGNGRFHSDFQKFAIVLHISLTMKCGIFISGKRGDFPNRCNGSIAPFRGFDFTIQFHRFFSRRNRQKQCFPFGTEFGGLIFYIFVVNLFFSKRTIIDPQVIECSTLVFVFRIFGRLTVQGNSAVSSRFREIRRSREFHNRFEPFMNFRKNAIHIKFHSVPIPHSIDFMPDIDFPDIVRNVCAGSHRLFCAGKFRRLNIKEQTICPSIFINMQCKIPLCGGEEPLESGLTRFPVQRSNPERNGSLCRVEIARHRICTTLAFFQSKGIAFLIDPGPHAQLQTGIFERDGVPFAF